MWENDTVSQEEFDALFECDYYEPVYGDGDTEDAHYVILKIKDGAELPADLELPLKVEGDYEYYMTGIEDEVFRGRKDLRSIVFPGTLTDIGTRAFADCSELKSVTFKFCKNVAIGSDAFVGCNAIEEVRINSVGEQCDLYLVNKYSNPMAYAKKVFVDGELLGETVEIPAAYSYYNYKVTEIRDYAFVGCEIKTLKFSEGIEIMNVNQDAFCDCDGLTTVILPESLTTFYPSGLVNHKNIKFNTYKGARYLGSESNPYKALVGTDDDLIECELHPNTEIICDGAFVGAKELKTLILPHNLKHFMSKALVGCNTLKTVIFAEDSTVVNLSALSSVTSIGYNVYGGLKYLGTKCNPYYALAGIAEKSDKFTVHPDTKIICNDAFKSAKKLVELTLPEGVTVIGNEAFAYCQGLTKIYLPSTLGRIYSRAFCGCGALKEVHISDIGAWCKIKFDCKLGDLEYTTPLLKADLYLGEEKAECVVVPSGVDSIEEYVFCDCKTIKRLELPKGVKYIRQFAFSGCTALEEVNIPDGVERIGAFAFNRCESLKEIDVPAVNAIGWCAFKNCKSLKRVTIAKGVETICSSAFEDCGALESIIIPDGVKLIGEYAFKGCASMTQAVLSDSVTEIHFNAFENCKLLEKLTLPRTLTKLGAHAFQNCRSLKSVIVPAVELIEHECFSGCYSLESAIISSGTKILGDEVFDNCKQLSRVELPEGLECICSETFHMCHALRELELPNSLKQIYPGAFFASGITYLKIPDGVELWRDAFLGMGALKRIEIPDAVTKIGRDIFRYCSDDLEVIASDKVKELIKNAK